MNNTYPSEVFAYPVLIKCGVGLSLLSWFASRFVRVFYFSVNRVTSRVKISFSGGCLLFFCISFLNLCVCCRAFLLIANNAFARACMALRLLSAWLDRFYVQINCSHVGFVVFLYTIADCVLACIRGGRCYGGTCHWPMGHLKTWDSGLFVCWLKIMSKTSVVTYLSIFQRWDCVNSLVIGSWAFTGPLLVSVCEHFLPLEFIHRG